MNSQPVIHAEGLTKNFGATRALDGLNLRVEPGEVHGFLGPNGAGKSTTMRVLLGLLNPDGGKVQLLGGDPWADAVKLHRHLAYVPGDVELWPNLTGGEAIDLFARLRGSVNRKRRDELCERFDLDPTKRARTYSKGNRQKVALISALASEVDLLLLDEPTAGLDPLMEVVFQQAIKEIKSSGKTVLLSSHILAQVEALADRVSIVRGGAIVETGSLQELRHMSRTTVVAQTQHSVHALSHHPGVHHFTETDQGCEFEVDGDQVTDVMRKLADASVNSLVAHPPTLEQLLMRHYGDDLRHTAAEQAPDSHGTRRSGRKLRKMGARS